MLVQIREGVCVTLHFTLKTETGEVVDSTVGGEPASFEFGDDKLPEGFQSLLVGLAKGDSRAFDVPPEKAFGMRNPSNIQSMKRDVFGDDIQLEPGLVVSFADASQSELPGVISKIEDDSVEVDFNHPLAGQTLGFEVEIIDVLPIREAGHINAV